MLNHNILDISMYQIKLFLLLVEERNFTRVAELSNISQPTISKRISQLEQSLDMQLFIRKKRPIALTPEGEALYNGWKDLHFLFEAGIEDAEKQQAGQGNRLMIASIDSGNELVSLPSITTLILKEYPYLEISLRYYSFATWRVQIFREKLDIMMTSSFDTENLSDRLEKETIITFPKGICVLRESPLANKKEIDLRELINYKFIMISPIESPEYSNYVRNLCIERGFEPSIAKYTPNAHNFINCLQHKDEVLICDRLLRGIDNPTLSFIPLKGIESGYVAVWRKDNHNNYIRPVIDIIKQYYMGITIQ